MTPEELEAQLQAARQQVDKVGNETRRLLQRPRSLFVSSPLEIKASVSSLRRVVTTGGGGSQSGTYTATHYVAPFASVSGATNDYSDLGATSWANAASSGTPTTLGTAMARAVAGNNVRCGPGVYIGLPGLQRFTPSFCPANAGTVSSPIVFFAQYPGAYNYGSTSLYSEIRKSDSAPGPSNVNAVLGPGPNGDHIIFDGFYADEDLTPSGPSAGIFQIASTSVGVQFRRCLLERGNSYTAAGYNANAIYLENCTDAVVTDCYFVGRITFYQSNKRQTGNIEVYDSANYLLKNNTHDGNYTGQYIKENEESPATYGRQCYNKFLNCDRAFGMQQGDNEADHNLVYSVAGGGAAAGFFSAGGPPRPNKTWNIHHNTFVVTTGGASGGGIFGMSGPGDEFLDCLVEDNLMVGTGAFAGRMTTTEGSALTDWVWSEWTYSRNHYYDDSGTLLFTRPSTGAQLTGLAAWQTESSGDSTATTGDPLFVNSGSHDYRLQGGSPAAGKGCYITGSEEVGLRADPTY